MQRNIFEQFGLAPFDLFFCILVALGVFFVISNYNCNCNQEKNITLKCSYETNDCSK